MEGIAERVASRGQAGADSRARIDGVELESLARKLGTPLHVYSAAAVRARAAEFLAAVRGLDAMVCFAVKANPNLAILQLLAQAGLGADVVSGGELKRALRAGIPARHIVFSGVGKTEAEIDAALVAGILRFNLESRAELELLQRVAEARGCTASAAVRINPDVDAGTHAKISTGRAENKFGVSIAEARSLFAASSRHPNVALDGLHVHIGSQILSAAPVAAAVVQVAAFARELADTGHRIASIDVGGGLGVAYHAGDAELSAVDYAAAVRSALDGFPGRVVFEPGRWLLAPAGVLLTRVIRVKDAGERAFLVVDAAMNDLLRPSLYDAWHAIEPVMPRPGPQATYDIVGPVCESSDTLGCARRVQRCEAGDLLMIRDTGAYGASMASTYNSRPLAAEVLVDDGRYAIVRRRQTFEEMVAGEQPATVWQSA